MKRLIVFLLILITFGGIYNFRIIWDSLLWHLDDKSYQSNDFSNARKGYENLLSEHSWSTRLEADTLYNRGNALYRLGQSEKDWEKIKLWNESIDSYTKSLSLRKDPETEENLSFVQEELKKETKEQEKKKKEQKKKDAEEKSGSGEIQKQEQTSQDKSSQQWKESKTGKNGEKETKDWSDNEKNKPKTGQNWSNGWSYNPIGWQDKDGINSPLSDAERQEVKKYLEGLKQFEKQNWKLLNPEKAGDIWSISDQIKNFFWSDSFFQDAIPSSDGKKDW